MTSHAALAVLSRSDVFHDRVCLPPGVLDRAVYVEINKILEALGGKWNRTKRAHLFAKDPRAAIETITAGGAVAAEKIVTRKKTLQAFYTPAAVADRLVEIAADLSTEEPLRFLEPSAGDGAIVRAIRRFKLLREEIAIVSVELDSERLDYVATFPGVDFLTTGPSSLGTFDAVIMNPPFTKGQDVAHVLHAWDFVRPGGVLVAIVSPAFRYRHGNASKDRWAAFRRLNTDRQLRGGVEIDLPAGTFKESGTNVATVIVGWVKP